MPSKKLIAAATAVVLLGGYGAADAFDVVPGVLTTASANEVKPQKVDGQDFSPLVPDVSTPPVSTSAPAAPSADAVKQVLTAGVKNPWLGETTAVTIRDAATGRVIAEHDSSKATTPASITKLLSAFAITHSKLPLTKRLATSAMLDGSTLTLVAGGDMVLARDAGDHTRVPGYAGLGDLADQAAEQLKKAGVTSVTVNSNTSYAAGPDKSVGWTDDLLGAGFTARISMLALADDRADNRTPAVADPTKNATVAFVDSLKKRGITATYGKNTTDTPAGTQVGVVHSATVLDLVGVALQDSDNSMIESLARQAAALDGVTGDSTKIGAWVRDTAQKQGVDVSGVNLKDASGLSQGTTLPVRVIGDLLSRGTSGKDPLYADVLTRLPVSSWNGTMHDRFMRDETKAASGVVSAKTGSLTGVSSLAGIVATKNGHLLDFVITTNGQFIQTALGAKAAIDQLVTKLSQL